MELALGIGSIIIFLLSLYYGVNKMVSGIAAEELQKQAEERTRLLEEQRLARQSAERQRDVNEANSISDSARAGDFLRGSWARSSEPKAVHNPSVASGSRTDDDHN